MDIFCQHLRAAAAEAEAQRRLPAQVMDEMVGLGLLRALVPRVFGGLEQSLRDTFQPLIRVAESCPATAWVASLLSMHGLITAWFPLEAQAEVWAQGPDAPIGSSLAPVGLAHPCSGGIQLEGRWNYASGLDHCQWLLLGARLEGRKLTALVPRGSWQVEEDWDVCGLGATGSHSLRVQEVVVPEHRLLFQDDQEAGRAPGLATHPSRLYRTPWRPMYSSTFVPAALGAAGGALVEARSCCASRVSAFTDVPLRQRPFAARSLALGASLLDQAHCLWEQQLRELETEIDDLARAAYRPSRIVALCLEAAHQLFPLGGAGSLRRDRPLQRYLRDLQAMAQHPAVVHESALELYGSSLMRPIAD